MSTRYNTPHLLNPDAPAIRPLPASWPRLIQPVTLCPDHNPSACVSTVALRATLANVPVLSPRPDVTSGKHPTSCCRALLARGPGTYPGLAARGGEGQRTYTHEYARIPFIVVPGWNRLGADPSAVEEACCRYAGKIELDVPIQRYLTWFRVADPQASAQVTVRHLLNNTSGLPQLPGMLYLARFDDSPEAVERQARSLSTLKLARPPGSGFEYSNLNYNLLGLIIEAASGESYANYVRNHIFVPLGMSHSHTSQSDAKQDGLAVAPVVLFASGMIRFMLLFLPDLTWITLISGGFAGVWAFLRTGLIQRYLREPSSPQTSLASSSTD